MTAGDAFAAVGSDGLREVVWGVGWTEGEAESDAKRWLAEGTGTDPELRFEPITLRQAERIDAGEIDWVELSGEEA